MAKKEIINNDLATVRVGESVVDVIEEAGDILDSTVEFAENAVDRVVTVTKNNPYLIAGAFIVGAGIGGFVVYKIVKKRLEVKYDEILIEEIDKAKTFHRRVAKEGEFESPESAVQALVPDEVVEAVKSYQGREKRVPYNRPNDIVKESPDPRPPVDVVVENVEVQQNVFVNAAVDPRDWDYAAEIADRELNPDKPYAISFEEFEENAEGYEQVTFTFYNLDETLSDENEKIIDNVEYVVGEDNLHRFGHGSQDANVVYVRNEKLSMDFEIVKALGSYKRDVLGMTEDDTDAELKHSRRRPNRRHWRTDE